MGSNFSRFSPWSALEPAILGTTSLLLLLLMMSPRSGQCRDRYNTIVTIGDEYHVISQYIPTIDDLQEFVNYLKHFLRKLSVLFLANLPMISSWFILYSTYPIEG